jgi:hypothetical protein
MVVKFTATFAQRQSFGKQTSQPWAVVRGQRGLDFTLALAVIWHIIKTFVPYTVQNEVPKKTATVNLQFSFFNNRHNIKDRNRNYLDVMKQNDFARQG